MTEKERMLAGKLYRADDPELVADHARRDELQRAINQETQHSKLPGLFRELLGSMGEGTFLAAPFHCDYGSHIYIGKHCYVNMDCMFLDVCDIIIGDDVYIAPRVSIYTPLHPLDAAVRNADLEYGKPVKIGSSVWIGGNVVINAGVTIGDNVVIGSGAVVTRDVPSGVLAVGNPCRVLRPITEEDRRYWQAQADEYRAWDAQRKARDPESRP